MSRERDEKCISMFCVRASRTIYGQVKGQLHDKWRSVEVTRQVFWNGDFKMYTESTKDRWDFRTLVAVGLLSNNLKCFSLSYDIVRLDVFKKVKHDYDATTNSFVFDQL